MEVPVSAVHTDTERQGAHRRVAVTPTGSPSRLPSTGSPAFVAGNFA